MISSDRSATRAGSVDPRYRQQQVVAELGRHAIVSDDIQELLVEAVDAAKRTLGVDYVCVIRLAGSGPRGVVAASAGWREGLEGNAFDLPPESQPGFALASNEPVIVEDSKEAGFVDPPLFAEHGVVAGLSVVIRSRDVAFGILGGYTTTLRQFSDDDVFFLRSVANVLGLALQRQRSTDAMRTSEATYRALAESTPVLVSVTRADGTIEFLNQQLLDYIGLTVDEASRGKWPAGLFHPDDAARDLGRWKEARAHGDEYTSEFRLRRHDGVYRWCFGRMAAVRGPSGVIERWTSATIDIHDRKLVEDALRTSEERLRRAQQAAKIGTFDWDLATNELIWDGVEEVHGREPGSFNGTFEAYQEDIHPDDKVRVTRALYAAVESGTGLDIEYRIICPDGSTRWVNGQSRVFTDEDGKSVRVTGTCQDVSERKRITDERERLLQELTVASAAKDDFLGMVSHELKTPITTILGNAQILSQRGGALDDESRAAALTDIYEDSQRLHRLIENLLALSRVGGSRRLELEPIIVARPVEKVVARHREGHPHREYRISCETGLPTGMGDVDYIEQVVDNLLTNAEKYSEAGSEIEINISSQGGGITVSIADRGVGVQADECARLFEPFYRSQATASKVSGTGIGLAVCKRLVEAHGGEMFVAPRAGGGSVFGFRLPA